MFLSNFLTVLYQATALFIIMAIGYLLYRVKLVDDKSVTGMTNVLLWAVTPCLLVETFSRPFDLSLAVSLGIFALAAFLAKVASALISVLIFRRGVYDDRVILRYSTIFSNCGFMGLPLAQALYGDEGVMYASIFVAVFNLCQWTWGFAMMSGKGAPMKKLLLNPGIIGLVLGLPLFFFSIQLPDMIFYPIQSVASVNTPLAMIVIGCHLAQTDLREAIRQPRVHIACLVRLIGLPLLFLAIFALLPIPLTPLALAVLVIELSAPTAATTVLIGGMCGRNTELGGQCVALSTLASVITLPLIATLAAKIFGV